MGIRKRKRQPGKNFWQCITQAVHKQKGLFSLKNWFNQSKHRIYKNKEIPCDEELLPSELVELIKVDDEVDEYVLLDIGELDVDAVEGEEELLSSTGRVVELVVNDVPSVVGVVTVVVLDDVDVFSVVGVIVVELGEEVYDVVDEELSSAGEDVELVLDEEVEDEPIDQNLMNKMGIG